MDHVPTQPSLSMSDSGIRRVGLSFWSWLKYRIIPRMAPRKHSAEDKVDPSQVVWRGFMTAITLAITTMTGYIAAHTSTNDNSEIKASIADIKREVGALKEQVNQTTSNVALITALLKGAEHPLHL